MSNIEKVIMQQLIFDFTPDPRVLIALTQTPITPMDALCELIDNSIDSFSNSRLYGKKIEHPKIWIDLPKKADLDKNFGVVRIRDNGPGMTTEQAEKAIKAGYSGNNSIDTLGLFGMGFNISTGKMGITTRFTTARKEDDYCTKTTIDLEKINETRSYQLMAEQTAKPVSFESGTQIEITKWWPEGHANHGFIYKLVSYGNKKIRDEIGRRYATILRNGEVQIIVNNDPCVAYEHCVWGSNRWVNNKRFGKIPAKYEINHVLTAHRRCAKCRSIIPENENVCPSCGCTEIRSVEERITGWIGIQRFDDASLFGIDLIRNGRAIKIGEKRAFFEFTDEFQKEIKDYPIDSPYGRIVGEVHLDFVPVDFLKQDFQRSSEEWMNAISYLRGNSSLQPKQEGADQNESIVFKLYQGYRKVRTAGTTDMYMGYWDKVEGGPKRISRDVEKEYYGKFLAKEPGFFDDAEWWKLVEEASVPPATPMITCPECGTQNLAEAEVCSTCNHIFKGKICVNEECGKEIPVSAVTCPYCEANQVPVVQTPWTCEICGTKNPAGTTVCKNCKGEKGAPNPLSETELLKETVKDDELSIENLIVKLANGQTSNVFSLNTYYSSKSLVSPNTGERLPMILFKHIDRISVIIDNTHPLFTLCGLSPVEVMASEVASYIYDLHRVLAGNPGHTISNIAWQMIRKYWFDKVEISEENIMKRCYSLLSSIKEQLAIVIDENLSDRFFNEMSEEQQKFFANEILKNNIPLSRIGELKSKGAFIPYVPNEFVLHILEESPTLFFNGNYWNIQYGEKIEGFSTTILQDMDVRTLNNYKNALETVVFFMDNKSKNTVELKRADAALNFLQDNRNDDVI